MPVPEQQVPDGGAAVTLPIRANGSNTAPASSNALTGKQEHCALSPPLLMILMRKLSSTYS
jgi:hypothetical protein